jgi:hypothetical protein
VLVSRSQTGNIFNLWNPDCCEPFVERIALLDMVVGAGPEVCDFAADRLHEAGGIEAENARRPAGAWAARPSRLCKSQIVWQVTTRKAG